MPEPMPAPSRAFIQERFEARIKELAERRGDLEIMEAGCGREWNLSLGGVRFQLTGVDSDEKALDYRRLEVGDLDKAIVGDLRTVVLKPAEYDVIYCAFVLEHVSGARAVLDRLHEALRPGGLMILRFPDRDSVWGFATRMTPFFAHVLYRRWIAGDRTAGQPGHAPYPTFYDRVVSHRGLRDYCADRGLDVLDEYSSNFYLRDLGRTRLVITPLVRLVGLLSLGRIKAGYNNLNFVLRKPDVSVTR